MSDEPDYLVSGPPISEEGILSSEEGDSEGFVEFDFETQAIFKRLADDIYKSDEAGIREPLTNAITAVIQAQNRHGLDNPQVEITVKDDDRPTIVMKDNGIGITQSVLNEVLSVIGRSMNRNEGEVSGKYGMGFLACYKLVGTDGGFVMHTRSRETGETISGLWTAGGFDPDPAENFPNPFVESDTYGTQFEFIVKEGITRRDIRSWVRSNAEWARLPVIYREFDEDGSEIFNEDYGSTELVDAYSDDDHVLGIETEYFDAYCTPSAESRTLLLDSPIGRNYRIYNDLPWDIDIRLKNENGVVVKGPNKGMEPIEDGEYDSLDPDQRDGVIPKSQLQSDDLTLPSPIGTRDSLGKHAEFWDWLSQGFTHEYLKSVGEIAERLDQTVDSFLKLEDSEQEMLMNALNSSLFPRRTNRIGQKFRSEIGVSVSDDVVEMLETLREKEQVVQRDEYEYSTTTRRSKTNRTEIWEVISDDDSDGDVWMGCNLTPNKVKVVFKDSDANTVVSIGTSDDYDKYEERFGWRRLRDIGSSNIDEFDIPDDLADEFKRGKKQGGKKGALTIHYGTNDDDPKSMKPTEVDDKLSGAGISYYGIDTLVVFPRADERNVGDHKWMGNKRIAVASCTGDQWEYLQDVDNVVRAKDYVEDAQQMRLKTAHGVKRATDLDFQNDVFHLVPQSAIDKFRQNGIIDRCEEYVQNEVRYRFNSTEKKYPNATYVPVTLSELDKLRPLFNIDDDTNKEDWTTVLVGDKGYDIGYTESVKFDARVYAYARLPEWEESNELQAIEMLQCSLEDGALELIESLGRLHDRGESPVRR